MRCTQTPLRVAIRLKIFDASPSSTRLGRQTYEHIFRQASSSEFAARPNRGVWHKFDAQISFGVNTAEGKESPFWCVEGFTPFPALWDWNRELKTKMHRSYHPSETPENVESFWSSRTGVLLIKCCWSPVSDVFARKKPQRQLSENGGEKSGVRNSIRWLTH